MLHADIENVGVAWGQGYIMSENGRFLNCNLHDDRNTIMYLAVNECDSILVAGEQSHW